MTERNLNEELLNELAAEKVEVEGYEYLSEDPLGNLTYANLATDELPAGVNYKILIGGDKDNVQDLVFHSGNPKDGIKGLTLEALIDIAIDRTIKLNDAVPSWHNNLAVDGLALAANALNKRNLDRQEANVTDTDKVLPRKGRSDFHPVVRRLLTNQDKLNFILSMMAAMSTSYDDVVDGEAQQDFVEMTPEGPKRKFDVTPEEDEAVTLSIVNSQKLLGVIEQTPLFQVIFSTMIHTKKLQGSTQQNTTPTQELTEPSNDSSPEQI